MVPLSSEDLERLVEIWEAAVLATHAFLPEGAVESYRPLLRDVYLPSVEVTVARDRAGRIQGFIGLAKKPVSALEAPEETPGGGYPIGGNHSTGGGHVTGKTRAGAAFDGNVATLADRSGNVGKIEMLFVHPEAHKNGVGRSLVEFAKSCYPALLVDVNEQNPGAVAFYERCGFVVRGRSVLDGQGNPYPLLHMRLG